MLNLGQFNSFDDYLKKLSKKARKNYKASRNKNLGVEYDLITYNSEKVGQFMRLWEKQLVQGENPVWAFPLGTVDGWAKDNHLLLFEAKLGRNTIAVHFIQKRDGYWECHPPLYDKALNHRYIGKLMWFNLFQYAIENKLGILDMGISPYNYDQYKTIYLPL